MSTYALSSVPHVNYSISVIGMKDIGDVPFNYSATDTIQTLNAWVADRLGVPATQQKLIVVGQGWLNPSKTELMCQPNELLIDCLKTAAYVQVMLK